MTGDPRADLRAAAQHLRDMAAKATPGPWSAGAVDENSQFVYQYGDYGWYVTGPAGSPELEDSETGQADARWIAAMSPDVAEHIATWLDEAAFTFENQDGSRLLLTSGDRAALTLARRILVTRET